MTTKTISLNDTLTAIYSIALGILILSNPLVTNADNIAIEGYDPVAYFSLGKAKKGNPQIAQEWDGNTWHFVSQAHKQKFINNKLANQIDMVKIRVLLMFDSISGHYTFLVWMFYLFHLSY